MSGTSPRERYFRCPACALIAQPESADYPIERATGDWTGEAARVRCAECGHQHTVTEADALEETALSVCPRCQANTPCQPEATRVECPACHLSYLGQATDDPATLAQVRATEGLRAVEQQAWLQEAKHRAGPDAGSAWRAT